MHMNHPTRQRTQCAVAAIAAPKTADSRSLARLVAVFLLAAALAATAFSGRVFAADSENIRIAKALSGAYAEVVEKVAPGVVGIETETLVDTPSSQLRGLPPGFPFDLDQFDPNDFFGPGGPRTAPRQRNEPPESKKKREGGIGSGVVIDQEGHILTNNHVVANADAIKVTFSNEPKKSYKAEIVGRDPNSDLAVIKLVEKPDVVPFIALGDSDALMPGNIIIAIGSPLGYKNSVTTGVVSATGRNLNELAYERFIQTDAAINPGNSGGPMVNLDGEVVGINTMISTRGGMGGSIGIGFAIPINQAKSVVQQLIEKGSVTRGWMGIAMNPEDKDISLELGHDGTGVLISDVVQSGPAAKAGIRKGDLIVSFDSITIKDNDHLRYLVADTTPGRDVPLVVVRDGERVNLTIVIEEQPADLYTSAGRKYNGSEGLEDGQNEVSSSLGLTVRNLDKATREKYGIPESVTSGVVITQVDAESEAREMGIRAGTVIIEMNKTPVKDITAFRKILKESTGKSKILVYLRQGEVSRFVMLGVK